MRPVITGELERMAEDAADEAGYQNAAEFVRDATRRRAEEVLHNHD